MSGLEKTVMKTIKFLTCFIFASCIFFNIHIPSAKIFAGDKSAITDKVNIDIPEIIAEFDNVKISKEDFQKRLFESLGSVQLSRKVGETFIRNYILEREAEAQNIKISTEKINNRYKKWQRKSGNSKTLLKEMYKNGLMWYSVKSAIKDAILFETLVRKESGKSSDSDLSKKDFSSFWKKAAIKYKNPTYHGLNKFAVATINGKDISKDKLLEFLMKNCNRNYLSQKLESIITDKQILQSFKNKNHILTSLDIEKSIAEIREKLERSNLNKPSTNRISLEEFLTLQGRTLKEFKKSLTVRSRAAFLKMLSPQLTDKMLAAYYIKNRKAFKIVHAVQLLAPFFENGRIVTGLAPIESKVEANEIIEKAENQLKNNKNYPKIDADILKTIAKNNKQLIYTEMGYLTKDKALPEEVKPEAYKLDYIYPQKGVKTTPISYTVPEITEKLFSLKKGEVGSAVESPVGYHILLRLDSRYPTSWQAVEQTLNSRLSREKGQQLVDRIKKEFKIKFYWQP
jgi:parvulin-like peptidyl-prolyl isomerase